MARTKVYAADQLVGDLTYQAELKNGRGRWGYGYPGVIWIRGYDLIGRCGYEERYANNVDKRCSGPNSKCGMLLQEATDIAELLNAGLDRASI